MEFENHEVDDEKMVIRRWAGEIETQEPLELEAEIKIILEAKVIGINHVINQRNGLLTRVYDVKVSGLAHD